MVMVRNPDAAPGHGCGATNEGRLLNDQDLRSQVGRPERGTQSRRAGTNDGNVTLIFPAHPKSLSQPTGPDKA